MPAWLAHTYTFVCITRVCMSWDAFSLQWPVQVTVSEVFRGCVVCCVCVFCVCMCCVLCSLALSMSWTSPLLVSFTLRSAASSRPHIVPLSQLHVRVYFHLSFPTRSCPSFGHSVSLLFFSFVSHTQNMRAPGVHECAVKVGAYVLGEYGHLLIGVEDEVR